MEATAMLGEAIYKGATRPAMKLGIPLVPLVILFGAGMLLIMWGGILVSWWVALAVLVAVLAVVLDGLLALIQRRVVSPGISGGRARVSGGGKDSRSVGVEADRPSSDVGTPA